MAAAASLLIAQYQALRDEILEKMRRNGQILSLTVLALGTLIAAGVQFHNAALVLIYPIVAASLAYMWVAEDQGIKDVGSYIRDKIEGPLSTLGYEYWEHWLEEKSRVKRRFRRPLLLFYLSTEAVSLVIAGYMSSDIEEAIQGLAAGHVGIYPLSQDTLLFALAVVAVVVSLFVLVRTVIYSPHED